MRQSNHIKYLNMYIVKYTAIISVTLITTIVSLPPNIRLLTRVLPLYNDIKKLSTWLSFLFYTTYRMPILMVHQYGQPLLHKLQSHHLVTDGNDLYQVSSWCSCPRYGSHLVRTRHLIRYCHGIRQTLI